MRALIVIGAAFVMACLVPTPSHADAPGPRVAAAKPDCKCPRVRPQRVVRHYRRAPKRVIAMLPRPVARVYYNTGIPSPWDSAYDRAMTLHFRSPFVTAIVDPEPGYPHTPPVRPVAWYRFGSGSRGSSISASIGAGSTLRGPSMTSQLGCARRSTSMP